MKIRTGGQRPSKALKLYSIRAEEVVMNAPKFMIMNILRIITPEEIGEITTKHNGGKFASLTELIDERLEKNIFRDFSNSESNLQHEAKILPFKRDEDRDVGDVGLAHAIEDLVPDSSSEVLVASELESAEGVAEEIVEENVDEGNEELKVSDHQQDENMSSFILIEKERFKRSQQVLKKKEIMELYQQTAKVEVEQIKHTNQNLTSSALGGVLVNKKQY